MTNKRPTITLLLCVLILHGCGKTNTGQPSVKAEAVFLTWQQDPTTTMTVDWHMNSNNFDPNLSYRKKGKEHWEQKKSDLHGFPFTERVVYRVELLDLEPNSEYEFKTGGSDEVYTFRTMPSELDRPIRFIEGGDVVGEGLVRMSRTAATYDPDFIVLGGDLSYSQGEPKNYTKWYRFFEVFQREFAGENNRIVPVIMAIGNHEIWHEDKVPDELPLDYYRKKYDLQEGDAPYYNALNAFPGQPEYGVLDFGDYLSWLILDTGHRNSITGEQMEWIEKTLMERKERPYLFTSYHVPAYPSHRSFDGSTSTEVRENWIPLFEEYGVDISFEHHDHTYKRTFPMKGNKVAETGIVFIGDGAWGVNSRELDVVHPRWYLKKAVAQRHVIVGTLDASGLSFQMVNEEGDLIDAYPENSEGSELVINTDTRVSAKKFEETVKASIQDSLILIKLYNNTGGEHWKNKNNWLQGPVQSWNGITMRGSRVSRIYLNDNNLDGELPREIVGLEGLERLYINGNPRLKGELPKGISNLKQLYRIRVNGNGIGGEIPSELGSMMKLRELLLSGNAFSGEIPKELSKLKLVTEINLSGNQLSGSIPSELGDLNFRLQVLNLSNNTLSGDIPEELGNARFLKVLDLSGNQLNGSMPESIIKLKEDGDLTDLKY